MHDKRHTIVFHRLRYQPRHKWWAERLYCRCKRVYDYH